MKTYEYKYRKRGLPESAEKTDTIEAKSFFEANAKAADIIGEECVIVSMRTVKDEGGE